MTPAGTKRRRAPLAEAIEPRVLLSTFSVTNTDDSGPGSLRQAMLDSNANPNPARNTIAFNIPGAGVHTIQPLTVLPDITAPVVIDGYTQPGATRNTLAAGDNAVLEIEIDGRMTAAPVLHVTGGSSMFTGLCINHGTVLLSQTFESYVQGNFLGTDPTGNSVAGSTDTVLDIEDGTTTFVGDRSQRSFRNVIGGGSRYGVLVNGGKQNLVAENLIGVGADGVTPLPNSTGISIEDSQGNAVSSNVICASTQTGVLFSGGSSNSALLNLIGLAPDGRTPIGNRIGLTLQNEQNDLIGINPATGNVISGNAGLAGDADPLAGAGLVLMGSTVSGLLQGNRIGTDSTGTVAVPNHGPGIAVDRASECTISNNVISGNLSDGVEVGLFGTPDPQRPLYCQVSFNKIGTDPTGTQPLGNGGRGVAVGTGGASGFAVQIIHNQICANGAQGVDVGGSVTQLDIFQDAIGTTFDGTVPLGNAGDGIRVENGASKVRIIQTSTIAFNGGNGVTIGTSPQATTTNVVVTSDSIFSNHGLGIDLGNDGVTPNTPGGPHTGPNQLQNTPIIDWARLYPGNSIRVGGTLDSTPNTAFEIDFFESSSANASGHVEGRYYRGSVSVTTDASGHARFGSPLLASAAGMPHLMTVTATGPGGTSEFSPPLTANDYAADLDGNFTVGFPDLLILAQHYGQPAPPQQGDFDLDGTVEFPDLLLRAQTYGQSLPTPPAAAASIGTLQTPSSTFGKRARLSALLKRLA